MLSILDCLIGEPFIKENQAVAGQGIDLNIYDASGFFQQATKLLGQRRVVFLIP
ncbi:hypothetical protein P378_10150 [Desulforamulus profundi]|uniref:Uncharacterized protein n=1 Tax=Desulforamulus profundi TaxID=1383067 RepID=A0A2C6MG46_9FIRM|nr:hypothetical protein P378_10150 [Desulforamulus profundi]